jgi:hypothetical protein
VWEAAADIGTAGKDEGTGEERIEAAHVEPSRAPRGLARNKWPIWPFPRCHLGSPIWPI